MSSKQINRLPKFFRVVLKLFVNRTYLEEILGDMEEIYIDLVHDKSPLKANIIFIKECILLIRPILLRTNTKTQKLNYYNMLNLFIKTSARQFKRKKLVTVLSLVTLIVGALFYQFVNSWVQNESSMNQFHSKINQIHMGVARTNPNADLTPISLQRFFNFDYSKFPEVQKVATMHIYDENAIKVITKDYEHHGKAIVTDTSFLRMFDFEVIKRNYDNFLNDPSKILVTQSFAKKLFGDQDAIGKTVEVKCDQQGTYKIGGVIKDIPSNSSISFDFLVPIHSQSFWRRIPLEVFMTSEFFDANDFNQKIAHSGRDSQRFPESVLSSYPLNSIYFNSPFKSSFFSKYGNSESLKTMKIVKWLILAITVITFINLQSTVQLSQLKNEGIKLAIGARYFELGYELLINRMLYFIFAFAISFLIYQWLFGFLLSSLELHIDSTLLLDAYGISFLLLAATVGSFGTSWFKILKSNFKINGRLKRVEKPKAQRFFTALQYSITVILLFSSLVIFNQFQFMLNKETGITQTNILGVDFFEMMTGFNGSDERNDMELKHQQILQELKKNPDIEVVSQGSVPIDFVNKTSWKLVGGINEYASENKMNVDPEFKDLFGLQLLEGRFFNDSLDSSGDLKVVINESAKKYFGIESIDNAMLQSNTSGSREFKFKVIGVVKDFHYEHLSQKINPVIMQYRINRDVDFLLSYNVKNKDDVVAFLEKQYRTVNEKGIFTYYNIENLLEEQYSKEKLLSKVYFSFAVVALLLSSIGLFTYAFYETKRRTKEVGIRKVNGAAVNQIFSLLSWSFLKTVILAYVVALPVSWLIMKDWLESFANRIDLSLWLFLIVGIGIFVISLLVVIWQTIKIAKINPVDALRYE